MYTDKLNSSTIRFVQVTSSDFAKDSITYMANLLFTLLTRSPFGGMPTTYGLRWFEFRSAQPASLIFLFFANC